MESGGESKAQGYVFDLPAFPNFCVFLMFIPCYGIYDIPNFSTRIFHYRLLSTCSIRTFYQLFLSLYIVSDVHEMLSLDVLCLIILEFLSDS